MVAYWIGFAIGALFTVLICRRIAIMSDYEDKKEDKGKSLNELTNEELRTLYTAVRKEQIRRYREYDNPFEEYEGDDRK